MCISFSKFHQHTQAIIAAILLLLKLNSGYSMSILSLQHITKRYASHTALDDVSMEVPRQSIFGLLGPNGAGKTSLIRIINQITAPDAGLVLFEGEKLQLKHVSQIGYLPEERGLYKKMPIGDQALYLAELKGMPRKEALKRLRHWFEKFDIMPWWDKRVEELSKGMQQKVQFIVTVLHEPQLLILDEPFSGFDPINANLVKKEILELKEKGCTIVLSTHRMESVEELCDNIALIDKSKKILGGSVADIRHAHKSEVYEVLFKGNLIAFTNALWTQFELISSCAFQDQINAKVKLLYNNTPNDLLQAILPIVQVASFREIMPGINDIFIQKVSENKSPVAV
jgi:ABC-2 type transport system ATP-binding protein